MKTAGIYVKLKITGQSDGEAAETEYYAYGAKGEIYYFMYGEDEDQIYLDLTAADSCTMYTCEKNNGNLAWSKTTTPYTSEFNKETMKQQAEAMAAGVWSWFGYYAGATGEGTKTTATMLGRTCDKYSIKQSAATWGAKGEVDCEYWIDQATGVCLKYSVSGSAVTKEGATSGSFAMEATEFRTNWTPTLPATTTTTGGGTSGGNTTQTSPFLGKRLTVTSVTTEPNNNEMNSAFADSYVQLYDNLNFECVSNLGCLLGTYITYSNATTNGAFLSTAKIYTKGAYDYELADATHLDELSLTYSDTTYTLYFTYNDGVHGEVNVTLTLADAGAVQAHDNTLCPLDPNGYGFDPIYQISQNDWDAFANGEYLFLDNDNFTVERAAGARGDTFKVDGNLVKLDNSNVYERTLDSKDANDKYPFTHYTDTDSDGVWVNENNIEFAFGCFNPYTGVILVPFAQMTYNATEHYYVVNSFTYDQYRFDGTSFSCTIQNYRVWFENGLVRQITYTYDNTPYTYTYSNWDNTDLGITLP